MFRTFATAAALVLTLTAAQASPATVKFGDLDLSRPADAHVLSTRIQQAAETACSNLRSSSPSMFYKKWFETCVHATSAEMTARVAALSSGRSRAVASK